VLFWDGVRTCFLVQPEIEVSCFEFSRGRVYGSQSGQLQGHLACKLLVGLSGQELPSTVIHCDNQSCIKLFENSTFHDRSKHIEIRYHFIRYWIQRGAV
jgi:hypothetical protein